MALLSAVFSIIASGVAAAGGWVGVMTAAVGCGAQAVTQKTSGERAKSNGFSLFTFLFCFYLKGSDKFYLLTIHINRYEWRLMSKEEIRIL